MNASRTGSTAASSPATSGRTGPVWNPATGEQQAEVDFASVEEVDAAVAAAKAAFPAWRATSLSRRAEVMFPFRELVDANRKEIAVAAHRRARQGARPTPLGEVARGLENIEFACGIPHLLKGGYSEQASTGVDVYSIRQPLGVVAGITPFNFPAMVPMWMFANAIACGNTFVLKPSEKDPSASLFLAELLQAGRPARRRVQRRARRQGGGRPPPRAPRHRRGQLRRLHADRPVHLRDRHRATASGCRRSAARRTTWSCCPTPTSTWPPTPPCRAAYGSAGERCMAISRRASPSAASPTRWSTRSPTRMPEAQGRPRHRARQRDGPADHRRAPRQGRRLPRRGAAEQGATVVVDGRDADVAGDGFFLGRVAARPRQAGHGRATTTRSSARCSSVVRVDTYDEARAT